MRLTVEHVRRAPQFVNAMQQREIDLRGLRISSLDENVLVLLDNCFDVVNLTANALSTLEYFPSKSTQMERVVGLIVHRNELQRVSAVSCAMNLPNVKHFLADQNRITHTRDLCFLRHWKKLEVVSLENNPVFLGNLDGYDDEKLRAFLVFLCPTLKLINYQRVRESDRSLAKELRPEFKAALEVWDPTKAAVSSGGAAEGKKIRKRGREGRELARNQAEQAALDEPVRAAPRQEVAGDAQADVEDTVVSEEIALQARLDELEERLMADDVTAEDMAKIEEEMLELSSKMGNLQNK